MLNMRCDTNAFMDETNILCSEDISITKNIVLTGRSWPLFLIHPMLSQKEMSLLSLLPPSSPKKSSLLLVRNTFQHVLTTHVCSISGSHQMWGLPF